MPAMVEPSVGVAPTNAISHPAAAHHEDPHRRLLRDAVGFALDPAIEPAPPCREEIVAEITVERRFAAKIDIAGIGQRAVAMRPRPEDQADRPALPADEPAVI